MRRSSKTLTKIETAYKPVQHMPTVLVRQGSGRRSGAGRKLTSSIVSELSWKNLSASRCRGESGSCRESSDGAGGQAPARRRIAARRPAGADGVAGHDGHVLSRCSEMGDGGAVDKYSVAHGIFEQTLTPVSVEPGTLLTPASAPPRVCALDRPNVRMVSFVCRGKVELEAALTNDGAKELVRQTSAYRRAISVKWEGDAFNGCPIGKFCGKHGWVRGTVVRHASPPPTEDAAGADTADDKPADEPAAEGADSSADPLFEVDMWRVEYAAGVIYPPARGADEIVPALVALQCTTCGADRRPLHRVGAAGRQVMCSASGCHGECWKAPANAEWLDAQELEVVLTGREERSGLRFIPAYVLAVSGADAAAAPAAAAPAAIVGGGGGRL